MCSEQACHPRRRCAGFRKLDVELDQHVEIVLEAAENSRLDDVEIADGAKRIDVGLGNAAGLLRRMRTRFDLRANASQAGFQFRKVRPRQCRPALVLPLCCNGHFVLPD
jgi:hypothetical protein